MELNNHHEKLQILIVKTWDLHVRINEMINQKGFSFCRNCSSHCRYCIVSESTVEEREKMMAIRDSLKELHNILEYLQIVRSRQEIQIDEALARLTESRKILIERVNQFPEKEIRKLDVLEEVIEFIGDGKTNEHSWYYKRKMDEKIEQKNVINGISSFLVRTTRFGLQFAVIFASIYTSVQFCRSRQQNRRLKKEAIDSRIMGKPESLLTRGSDIHLDVLCGRG